MATKRAILEHMTADELRGVIDQVGLVVDDRRTRGRMIEAIAASRKADLEPALDDSGREIVLKQAELLAADWVG